MKRIFSRVFLLAALLVAFLLPTGCVTAQQAAEDEAMATAAAANQVPTPTLDAAELTPAPKHFTQDQAKAFYLAQLRNQHEVEKWAKRNKTKNSNNTTVDQTVYLNHGMTVVQECIFVTVISLLAFAAGWFGSGYFKSSHE